MSEVLVQENVEGMICLLERVDEELLELSTMTTVAVYSDYKEIQDDDENGIAWHLNKVLTDKIGQVQERVGAVCYELRNGHQSEEAA